MIWEHPLEHGYNENSAGFERKSFIMKIIELMEYIIARIIEVGLVNGW